MLRTHSSSFSLSLVLSPPPFLQSNYLIWRTVEQTTKFVSQKATRWHYRAIKQKICAGICFSPLVEEEFRASETALAVRGDRCFGAASNTGTVPSVDGLTWLTLINISKISDESPSGSRGEYMPLHLASVSVIFLLMYFFFLNQGFFSCACACLVLGGKVVHQCLVPWECGYDTKSLFNYSMCWRLKYVLAHCGLAWGLKERVRKPVYSVYTHVQAVWTACTHEHLEVTQLNYMCTWHGGMSVVWWTVCETANIFSGKLSWETAVGAVCIIFVVLWQAT